MIVRSSTQLFDGFTILTLGHSCHYVLGDANGYAVIDPGSSAHIPGLIRRLTEFGFPLKSLRYILATHLHAHRMGGVPLLKRSAPQAKFLASSLMQGRLMDETTLRSLYDEDLRIGSELLAGDSAEPTPFDHFQERIQPDKRMAESELISIDEDLGIRVVNCPGHTAESVAFLLQPFQFLIVDEGFAYFRGRKLAAPGADFDLNRSLESIARFDNLEVAGLGLPFGGFVTGSLVRKHLQQATQNSKDLMAEAQRAFESGMTDDEIRTSIREGLYLVDSADPVFQSVIAQSFERVWTQLVSARQNPTPPVTDSQES
jgi:glyoxylase-like metal-dependent hydrolase (beta-lactamase superfamily II)